MWFTNVPQVRTRGERFNRYELNMEIWLRGALSKRPRFIALVTDDERPQQYCGCIAVWSKAIFYVSGSEERMRTFFSYFIETAQIPWTEYVQGFPSAVYKPLTDVLDYATDSIARDKRERHSR